MLAPRRPGGRLGAGPQSSAKEACRDDAGVVQNHQFATPQQRRELNELTIFPMTRRTIQQKEARRRAIWQRMLSDAIFRQPIVELVKTHCSTV